MKTQLLISAIAIAAAAFGAGAQEPEFEIEFSIPELPVIQLCAVEEGSQQPVPFAEISVEYVDTIVSAKTDGMGLLDFTPRSFPLTVTASGEGMQDVTYGLMEHPEEPLTILMTREPIQEEENTTNMISAFAIRPED